MKALLIVAALNMQLVYDDMAVCRTAQSELKNSNIESICIPKGEDVKSHDMMTQFIDLVMELQAIQNKEQ
jgi:3-dehydroquinate synthetase